MRFQVVGLAFVLMSLSAVAHAGSARLPLPHEILAAKSIYIDNQAEGADFGDKAYDELKKWGRFEIVDAPDKADMVLLLSSKEYVAGYTHGSYHDTTGNVDANGNVNAQTYGNGSSRAIYSGTTYITLIDAKTGTRLWSDARQWGRFRSATRGIIKELRDRINKQEATNNVAHAK